jgi:hypothetical protein
MVLHLLDVSLEVLKSGDQGCTIYWVVVMPLISLAVHEDHDIRKLLIVIDYVSVKCV